jgi:hypothetical protein
MAPSEDGASENEGNGQEEEGKERPDWGRFVPHIGEKNKIDGNQIEGKHISHLLNWKVG